MLGLGFAAATKATWVVGFLLGATGSYKLARRWFPPAVALVASLAFTYAPYHLSQIYVRAALAEFMALVRVALGRPGVRSRCGMTRARDERRSPRSGWPR